MEELLTTWLEEEAVDECENVILLSERDGGRDLIRQAIPQLIADHLVDLSVIERMGGYAKAASTIRNRLPTNKKSRSGDFGEIVATEFINQQTTYRVPCRRLRFKDDRNSAMRGDDVVGIRRRKKTIVVLKAEAKSRQTLSDGVVSEASVALAKYDGRPNPSSLAFLAYILRKENRDAEAEDFENLQNHPIAVNDVEHLIFTVSGNSPKKYLVKHATTRESEIDILLVGCRIEDHGTFIAEMFDAVLRLKETNADG